MSRPILVDTDVLIDFLRGYEEAMSLVSVNSESIVVSTINVAELYAGVRGGADGAEQSALDRLLALFRVIPVGSGIARLGGLYKRDYGRSHGVGLADAIVAATATVEDAALMTINVKHYPMFSGIQPAYRK
ncbi:MAG: type II toxin-antitoxin system VapC family toxin [Acidobacteria bacterium]|nr:type II toxin-antitoxin system VapC family toxin [Acidobacteriota bacterium]MYD72602.1 type II toxin-antitoxin system VapC family toxin [Acidobacteriota bacterium]MYJ05259.1 type II toxin-antitoxin system VapC family toxin [Acidobacteriota bacterium]